MEFSLRFITACVLKKTLQIVFLSVASTECPYYKGSCEREGPALPFCTQNKDKAGISRQNEFCTLQDGTLSAQYDYLMVIQIEPGHSSPYYLTSISFFISSDVSMFH